MAKTSKERTAACRERKKKELVHLDGWYELKLWKQLMEVISNYKG